MNLKTKLIIVFSIMILCLVYKYRDKIKPLFIKKEPYRSIFLTLKGQIIASESKKRHNIVYNFLLNLGLDKNTASEDAEGIEHHVSEKTLRKMDNFNSKK